MKTIYSIKDFSVVRVVAIATVIIGLFCPPVSAVVWNFTVPANEIRPVNGVFSFPTANLEDGKAKHFIFKHTPDRWIRFFLIKSSDGVIRAAFDACDVCYKARKGYVQTGDNMTCINCGLKFPTTKINEVKGGCNPAPLRRSVKGDKLIITVADVLLGRKFFQ